MSNGESARPDYTPDEGAQGSFPTHAVVGVVTSPQELLRVREELEAAGLQPHVLAGDRGVELIEAASGSTAGLRLTRTLQGMFGYEAEHTERHLAELEHGNFIVLVESHDDATTERVADVLRSHGAVFTHYYSRWTSRSIIP